jgi:hypothetical protein
MKSAIGSAALRLQRCLRVRAPPEAGRREGRRRGRRQRPRRGCGLRRTRRPIRSSDVFSRSLLIGSQFCPIRSSDAFRRSLLIGSQFCPIRSSDVFSRSLLIGSQFCPIRSSYVFSRSLLIGAQFCLGYLLGGDSRLVEKFRFLCKATTAFTLFTKTC